MNSDTRWPVRPARPADWPAIRELLVAGHLPLEGVEDQLANFIVAEIAGNVVGCAGLEVYGEAALLRSCAVAVPLRGLGMGHALIEEALRLAASRDVHAVVLLTTTAEHYFPRFGFQRIERSEMAESLQASKEFRGACPASASVLRLILTSN